MAESQSTKKENESTPKQNTNRSKQKSPKMATFCLDSSNCQKLYAENTILQRTLKNKTLTHKFIISNNQTPKLSKRQLLEAFTNQCLPNLIIPMHIEYRESSKNLVFFCHNCTLALDKLIKDNLIITTTVKSKEIKLNITMFVACKDPRNIPANYYPAIRSLLEHRVTSNEPVMANLCKLDNISGWCTKLYINLKAPLAINVILNSLRKNNPRILDLQQNDIVTLRGWMNYFTVDSVNLANTKIKRFQDLGPLLKMDLKKINLQATPLRQQYDDQERFNDKVRELFPNAVIVGKCKKKIDEPISPPPSPSEYDGIKELSDNCSYLVDQFMEHYFYFYDNPKTKRHLEDVYHKEAIFSMTSYIIDEPGGLNPVSERFKHHAHNLLDKNVNEYVVGPTEIIRKLCYLPNVIHDPTSFRVDVLHYTENEKVLFSINGAFKESRVYKFSRTFCLEAEQNGEYQIKNDLLHVTNDFPSYPPFFSDSYSAPITININLDGNLPFIAKNKAQQYGMTIVFIEITTLHVKYATEILNRAHWDIRQALEIFVQEVRYNKFSPEHFLHEEIKHIVFNCLPPLKGGMNVNKVKRMLHNMHYLTEDKYILQNGTDNKILNKCKKDEIRKLLKN